MKSILVVMAVLAAACGGGQMMQNTPAPIPDTPLAGTIKGSSFTAKGAIATHSSFGSSSPIERSFTIANVALTCADQFSSHDPEIIFSTDWKAGPAKSLGLASGQTVTFVTGGNDNNIATEGQLEVVSAPAADAGVPGTIKLRATAGSDMVEGAIDVTVCPEN